MYWRQRSLGLLSSAVKNGARATQISPRVHLQTNSLLQDLRYDARMLLEKPGFTLVAVITPAFCIGANTGVFSLVYEVTPRQRGDSF
jgi:hypothetical protein